MDNKSNPRGHRQSAHDARKLLRLPFRPDPARVRRDGWTAQRQIAFIETLAETGCVQDACRRVGLSRQSAYAFARRLCGRAFREAWEAAIDFGLLQLEQEVIGRARFGVSRPIFFKGEQVGEYREFDERLAMFLLRARRGSRFGAWIDRLPSPLDTDDDFATDDSALRLDFHLDEIAGSASDDDGDNNDDAVGDGDDEGDAVGDAERDPDADADGDANQDGDADEFPGSGTDDPSSRA